MTEVPPRRDELMAVHIVSQTLGTSWGHIDKLTHEGKHDFDLVFEDGSVGTLEVTTATDKSRRSLENALQKYGLTLGPAALARSWHLWARPNVNVRDLRRGAKELALHLGYLESLQIESFYGRLDAQGDPAVAEFLHHYPGIKSG